MAEEFAPGVFTLGYDSFSGELSKMHVDTDGKMHFTSETQIDAIAEANINERNDISRTTKSGDMVRVARIPMSVHLDLMQRGILRDNIAMRRWLRSPEAAPYKTHWMNG
ncbi:hypothetical protein UFOVP1459_15 [uncultured Caudovirales phage]|uniref:Uncharacterized protein n=1 Tax=uncultured Caudovirales phage TaxID=2100421 RepID=A0A6J5SIB2_9CAUD|nr:hypothetical protein UFOVP1459_15 [uncultured Caudovirales phage]CAB4218858.1 hypothetical protein UFOVP1609_47 [uncultured Caudovirales phage]